MPDVSRSDSNRSDASIRPRVSFNRDVHVKRISSPRTTQAYSVTQDGSYLPTSIQRENPKTRRQMAKEAEQLLKQVDKIKCSASSSNVNLDKKKTKKRKNSFLSKNEKQSSSELDSGSSNEYRVYKVNRKEEPKNFMSLDRKKLRKKNNTDLEYLSLERDNDSFDKEIKKPKPPKLRTDLIHETSKKKPLSPIIESPSVVETEKPLSRVGKLVRRLSSAKPEQRKPPVSSSVLKQPANNISHNNNQPFSYTEPSKMQNLDIDELKSTSPTNDVIYAQVVVSGRGLGSQKTTIHTRVPKKVGVERVSPTNNRTYQSLDEVKKNSNNMWSRKEQLYGENPGRRDLYRRSSESSRYSSPSPNDFERNSIKIAPKFRSKSEHTISDAKLSDLSLRREILMSRMESQAKERYHSLKRIKEPNYLNDIRVNERFHKSLRRIPDDVELIEPRVTRESKYDNFMKEKETWKKNERVHTPPPKKERDFITKITRIGKSKTFIEDVKPWNNKMKSLFRKKKDGGKISSGEDDPLTTRYTEYRGSDLDYSDISRDASPRRRKLSSDLELSENDYGVPRKRFPTPISSQGSNESITKLTKKNNLKNSSTPNNWFKSLDRLTKKGKQRKNEDSSASVLSSSKSPSSNLRFFGDTDQESINDVTLLPIQQLKNKYKLHRGKIESDTETTTTRCNSRLTDSTLKGSASGLYKYDLGRPDYGIKHMRQARRESFDYGTDTSTVKDSNFDFNVNGLRYGPKVQRSVSSVTQRPSIYEQRNNPQITITKPDANSLSRRVKSQNNLYKGSYYDSTDDSTSLNKSTVYLHAATVGDIPVSRNIYRSDGHSASREELSTTGSSIITPQTRTVSRSFSVLAPWRPKHNPQDTSLHYESGTKSELGKGKPPPGTSLLKNKRSFSRERKPSELNFNTLGKENRRQKDLLR